MKKYAVTVAIILVLCVALTGCGGEQKKAPESNYPNKPITIIVPYSAGGSSDVGTRLVAKRLEKELGQPVVVENVPGAAGWVGWQKLAKAKPDGYTLASFNLAYIPGYLNPAMKRDMNLNSLDPFVNHVWEVTAWAVKPGSPFKDVKELLEYVKKNPDKISVGTSGPNTQHHIALIALEKMGYKMKPVHSNGSAESVTLAMGGHIDVVSAGAGELKNAVNDKALRVLAVLDTKRSKFFPDVPTVKENAGIELTAFAARGFAGPLNMDPAAIKRLDAAFKKVIDNPEHVKEMDNLGLEVRYMPDKEYQEFLKKFEADTKKTMGW